MNSSAVLIINPISGTYSEKKLHASIGLLKKHFLNVNVHYTTRRGDAESIARTVVKDAPEMILVAGGDGTFNEVVNGIALYNIPIALLPSGTTNVLARELAIPQDIYKATVKALKGKPYYFHLGHINTRYFVLMAGVGFDGEVVHGVVPGIKKLTGKGAYLISGLRVFWKYNPELFGITVDGREYEGYGLIACNSKYYAGRFSICPDASLRVPELYVFIMHRGSRCDLLRYVIGILYGNPQGLEKITYVKGKEIYISGSAHVQIDGDYYGKTPAKITIKERAIRIIT